MSSKPNVLAKFIKGKLIDVIPGVSATLNWVISCWDRFETGNGLKFEKGSLKDGKPKLELNIKEGDNISFENDKDGAIKISSEGGGQNYIKGDDTNIVFTPVTSGDDAGKVKIDVYYV